MDNPNDEYFDGDSRWATEDEARDEFERRINNAWEIWFKMVAVNYPEREQL